MYISISLIKITAEKRQKKKKKKIETKKLVNLAYILQDYLNHSLYLNSC